MGRKKHSVSLFLGAILIGACWAAFQIGSKHPFAPQAIEEATSTSIESTVSKRSLQERNSWYDFPILEASDAIAAIKAANDSGNTFHAHYTCLYAARRLSDEALNETILGCADISTNEAEIINVILLLELAQRDPNQLVALLGNNDITPFQNKLIQAVFIYWAKEFPELAFKYALQMPEHLSERALKGVAQSGNKTATALIEDFEKQKASLKIIRFRETVLEKIEAGIPVKEYQTFSHDILNAFRDEPHVAIDLLSKIDDQALRESVIDSLIHANWESPVATLQAIDELYKQGLAPKPSLRIQRFTRILSQADAPSELATLEWMGKNLNSHELTQAIGQELLRLELPPKSILESAAYERLPISPRKLSALANIFAKWARTDFQNAVSYASNQLQGPQSSHAIATLTSIAIETGGTERLDEVYSMLSSASMRSKAIRHLSSSWGSADPLTFLDWVSGKDDDGLIDTALANVSTSWVTQDIDSARAFAELLPDGKGKYSLQEQIGYRLAQDQPLKAIEFASQVNDESKSQSIISKAAIEWGQEEPQKALEFLESTQSDSGNLNWVTNSIATGWAYSKPKEASDYFLNHPDDTIGLNGLSASVLAWAKSDPLAASEFASNLAPSTRADRVLHQLATNQNIAHSNPQQSLELIARIQGEQLRNSAINIVSQWIDPELLQ